jgi:hypothetical protein
MSGVKADAFGFGFFEAARQGSPAVFFPQIPVAPQVSPHWPMEQGMAESSQESAHEGAHEFPHGFPATA